MNDVQNNFSNKNFSNEILVDYNSPTVLQKILNDNNFSMQKKFGQNFLVNETMRKKIIEHLSLKKNMNVWEIGPGLGCMTKLLLDAGCMVTAFEIDKGFIFLLLKIFQKEIAEKKLRIVEGDAMQTWKKIANENGTPDIFFGNLPYNIASHLLADTIEKNVRFPKMFIVVQKEVALRMIAKPAEKNYSSFSVLCNFAYDVKLAFDLSKTNFWPKPNVTSSAVLFTPKKEFQSTNNVSLFIKLNRALFSSRRKTLRNNLGAFLQNNELASRVLSKCEIAENLRAENLPLEKLLLLSSKVNDAILKK